MDSVLWLAITVLVSIVGIVHLAFAEKGTKGKILNIVCLILVAFGIASGVKEVTRDTACGELTSTDDLIKHRMPYRGQLYETIGAIELGGGKYQLAIQRVDPVTASRSAIFCRTHDSIPPKFWVLEASAGGYLDVIRAYTLSVDPKSFQSKPHIGD